MPSPRTDIMPGLSAVASKVSDMSNLPHARARLMVLDGEAIVGGPVVLGWVCVLAQEVSRLSTSLAGAMLAEALGAVRG